MYLAVITPYIRSCLWYFLRFPLIHTRVLSEILSSRGFHTQYIDSQFWLGNWHLWLCICLPVLLKQTLWRVLHVKSWKKDANIYNCPFADFFWTSRYREFSETQTSLPTTQSNWWQKSWVMLILLRNTRNCLYRSGTPNACVNAKGKENQAGASSSNNEKKELQASKCQAAASTSNMEVIAQKKGWLSC